jgi:hypothetical protein
MAAKVYISPNVFAFDMLIIPPKLKIFQ